MPSTGFILKPKAQSEAFDAIEQTAIETRGVFR